jgi:hypothetical protein
MMTVLEAWTTSAIQLAVQRALLALSLLISIKLKYVTEMT